jgi:hypothetical protein
VINKIGKYIEDKLYLLGAALMVTGTIAWCIWFIYAVGQEK